MSKIKMILALVRNVFLHIYSYY